MEAHVGHRSPRKSSDNIKRSLESSGKLSRWRGEKECPRWRKQNKSEEVKEVVVRVNCKYMVLAKALDLTV